MCCSTDCHPLCPQDKSSVLYIVPTNVDEFVPSFNHRLTELLSEFDFSNHEMLNFVVCRGIFYENRFI
jgi:hypothetical protein